MTAGDAVVHLKREERWRYGEGKASEAAENLCIRPWRETAGKVPLILVSSAQLYLLILLQVGWMTHLPIAKLRYKDTIQKLIEATDREIQQQRGVQSYTEPDPLNWAAAQRGDNGLKIKASVEWVFTLHETCPRVLTFCWPLAALAGKVSTSICRPRGQLLVCSSPLTCALRILEWTTIERRLCSTETSAVPRCDPSRYCGRLEHP